MSDSRSSTSKKTEAQIKADAKEKWDSVVKDEKARKRQASGNNTPPATLSKGGDSKNKDKSASSLFARAINAPRSDASAAAASNATHNKSKALFSAAATASAISNATPTSMPNDTYEFTNSKGSKRQIIKRNGQWLLQEIAHRESENYIDMTPERCELRAVPDDQGSTYFYIYDKADFITYYMIQEKITKTGTLKFHDLTSGSTFALFHLDRNQNPVIKVNLLHNDEKNITYQIDCSVIDKDGLPQVTTLSGEKNTVGGRLSPENDHEKCVINDVIKAAKDTTLINQKAFKEYYLTKITNAASLEEKHQLLKQLKPFVTKADLNEIYQAQVLTKISTKNDAETKALVNGFKALFGKNHCLVNVKKKSESSNRKSTYEVAIFQRVENTLTLIGADGKDQAVIGTHLIGRPSNNHEIYADEGNVYHLVAHANGAIFFYKASAEDISIASEEMVTDPEVLVKLINLRPATNKIKPGNMPETLPQSYKEKIIKISNSRALINKVTEIATDFLRVALKPDAKAVTNKSGAKFLSTADALQAIHKEVIPALLKKAVTLPEGGLESAFPQLQTQLALMGHDIQLIKDVGDKLVLLDIDHSDNNFTAYALRGTKGKGHILKANDKSKADLYVTENICYEMTRQAVNTENPVSATLTSTFDDDFVFNDTNNNAWFVYRENESSYISQLHATPQLKDVADQTYVVTLEDNKLSITVTIGAGEAPKEFCAEAASNFGFFEDFRRKNMINASADASDDDLVAVDEKANRAVATRQEALGIATAWQSMMTMDKALKLPIAPSDGKAKEGEALETAHIVKYQRLLSDAKATSELIDGLDDSPLATKLKEKFAKQITALGKDILSNEAITNTQKLALFNGKNDVLLKGSNQARWQVSHSNTASRATVFLVVNEEGEISPHVQELCTLTTRFHNPGSNNKFIESKDAPYWAVENSKDGSSSAPVPGWADNKGNTHAFAWVEQQVPGGAVTSASASKKVLHHFTYDATITDEQGKHYHWRNAGIDAFASGNTAVQQTTYHQGVSLASESLYHDKLAKAAAGHLALELRDYQDLLRIGDISNAAMAKAAASSAAAAARNPTAPISDENLTHYHGYQVIYLFQTGENGKRVNPNGPADMIKVSSESGGPSYYFKASYNSATGDYHLTQLLKVTDTTPAALANSTCTYDLGKTFAADPKQRPARFLSEFVVKTPQNVDQLLRQDQETAQLIIHAKAFEEMLGLNANNDDGKTKKLRSLEAENLEELTRQLMQKIHSLRAELGQIEKRSSNPNTKDTDYTLVAWKLTILETHFAKLTTNFEPQVQLGFKNTAIFDPDKSSAASAIIQENENSATMAFNASGTDHNDGKINAYFVGNFIKSGDQHCLKSLDFSESAMSKVANSGLALGHTAPLSKVPGTSRAFTLATGYELLFSNVNMPSKTQASAPLSHSATLEEQQQYNQQQQLHNNVTHARNSRALKINLNGGLAYDNYLFQITRNIMLGVDLPIAINNKRPTLQPAHLFQMIQLFQSVGPGKKSLSQQKETVAKLSSALNPAESALFDLLLSSPTLAQGFANSSLNKQFDNKHGQFEQGRKLAEKSSLREIFAPIKKAIQPEATFKGTVDLSLEQIAHDLQQAAKAGLQLGKGISTPKPTDDATVKGRGIRLEEKHSVTNTGPADKENDASFRSVNRPSSTDSTASNTSSLFGGNLSNSANGSSATLRVSANKNNK